MDISDSLLSSNRDWDPSYLNEIFQEDFYEFSELWSSNVMDSELVQECNKIDIYCPVTEDISLDDQTLCSAVEHIEKE